MYSTPRDMTPRFIGKWHLAASNLKYVDKHKPWDSQRAEGAGECQFVPPGPARLGFQYWAGFNFHCCF